MITLDEAKQLQHRQILYHSLNRNADGTPQRWRVSGNVKTWKRDASRFRVPVKYGLYTSEALSSQADLDVVCLTEKQAEETRP